MFQSFTGNSRRPRQVNLSGQNIDPFAASAWTSDAAGARKTVAAAQLERHQRQQERDRLNATRQLQRIWRGHKARRDLRDSRRAEWDTMIEGSQGRNVHNLLGLPYELRLLLTFFDARNLKDINRISRFSDRVLLQVACENPKMKLTGIGSENQLSNLARCLLDSLGNNRAGFHENLLRLSMAIIDCCPQAIVGIVERYYEVMSSLIQRITTLTIPMGLFLDALRSPLTKRNNVHNSCTVNSAAYIAFSKLFLTVPNLSGYLGGLKDLAAIVDFDLLSHSIIDALASSSRGSEHDLWLLAHFICLHRLKEGIAQGSSYIKAMSVLLSVSASEIIQRIDVQDAETLGDASDDESPFFSRGALPNFVTQQLLTLVDKDSVTGLLSKFDSSYTTASTSVANDNASILASYALILLRIFPKLSEEIRMWLYQGSVILENTDQQVPAVKLFWHVMSSTRTFSAICHDPTSALNILHQSIKQQAPAAMLSDTEQDRDWRAILLFLELYAFVLRFTDDEEFLSGGMSKTLQPSQPISRSRASALALHDVKLLTVFLKNLAFVMYFNGAELLESGEGVVRVGLAGYFGADTPSGTSSVASRARSPTSASEKRLREAQGFLGVAGMTFSYVRDMAMRVMRMLYERDSRRRFLSRTHWLMTSRFDMEGFIPAVVMEEERRHQVVDNGGEAEEEEEQMEGQFQASQRNPSVGVGRARLAVFQEDLRRQQQRTARKRLLAAIGPRLEILQNMPFVIPFETRVQIFRQFVLQDQIRRRNGYVDPDQWRMSIAHHGGLNHGIGEETLGRHHAKIHRDNVLEDAYEQFYKLGEGLKEPIQITFVDKFDTIEAGIDGGGVTKEFLISITNEAFRTSSDSNLFTTNDQNLLFPNPVAMDETRESLREAGIAESSSQWTAYLTEVLKHYEFLGRIIGKCLYEGILIDLSFAGFFLLKWASTFAMGTSPHDSGYLSNINDLRDLDEALYQGLLQLKDYSGDVEDFSLDFTITDIIPGSPPKTVTRELRPNGRNIPVTNENRVLYISGVARHRLHGQSIQQTRAFLRGLGDIINPSWLSMFNQTELQTLIGGDSSEVDIDDLRQNTAYSGVYQIGDDGLEHPTVQLFWNVMKGLDDSDRRKVLKYVTSTPRAPLLGFSQLKPRFSIRDAGADEQRLPSTSTCINLMKLPRYSTATTLREKLLYAINSGAGFDLS